MGELGNDKWTNLGVLFILTEFFFFWSSCSTLPSSSSSSSSSFLWPTHRYLAFNTNRALALGIVVKPPRMLFYSIKLWKEGIIWQGNCKKFYNSATVTSYKRISIQDSKKYLILSFQKLLYLFYNTILQLTLHVLIFHISPKYYSIFYSFHSLFSSLPHPFVSLHPQSKSITTSTSNHRDCPKKPMTPTKPTMLTKLKDPYHNH